jgi:T5SS/PEP-CTERM-associated repeat protein
VESLILSEGAMLQWSGGTIEVAGGLYTQAELDLLIGNGTLRLLDGATATIQRHVFIGLTPAGVGVLEIDGDESSLISGEAIFVGVDGHGLVHLLSGGMIVTPEMIIGPMGELAGDGVIDGDLLTDGVLTVQVGDDLLAVTGMAQLGGTLHLVLPEGLEVGDQFTALTAATVIGQFTAIETPADVTVTVTYELDRVTITVTEAGPKLTPDQAVQFEFLPE